MGNFFTTSSASPAPLGKTHDPCFKWKIHDFSVLLERGAMPINSAPFHFSGHKWFLRVAPSHTKSFAVGPYVALSLGLRIGSLDLEPDYTLEAVFVLATYNHSNGLYYGSEASYMFHINNTNSTLECLIPLKELLKSPDFLAEDCCVFGVEILKVDVFPHEKEAVVVQKKAPTVQNLFIQKNGFVTRNCTLTLNNFLELNLQHFVRSAMFEIDGHKWHLGIYPRGDQYSTSYLSLYLCMDASDKLPPEFGKLVEMSLSILDQSMGNITPENLQLWWCLRANVAGDGPTSFYSAYSGIHPVATLYGRAALSRRRSLSSVHPMVSDGSNDEHSTGN